MRLKRKQAIANFSHAIQLQVCKRDINRMLTYADVF